MTDIHIRKEGRIGRITLDRPHALNALSYDMGLAIEAALDDWAGDDAVACVLIDAQGDRAFCAGGDLQLMYDSASAGDFDYGRRFWRDEYRMNAKVFHFPKPYIAMMQGYTMGGGVGISCHGSHRVVGDTSRIAMPECAVGLVPDVGGSLILARAPGMLGTYLGMTGHRMDAADAIHAGFADYYIPEADWPALTARLIDTGDWTQVDAMARPAPASALAEQAAIIDTAFAGQHAGDIVRALPDTAWGAATRAAIGKGCPLSVACTVELVRRVRAFDDIRPALQMEFRFTARSASDGDFVEGIRAAIIDKDRAPRWRHADVEAVPLSAVSAMLRPIAPPLTFEEA
ncbi:MAG: enoyl-CoA hydratase/isomerase family protein [Pseudomonadota bacterium]